MTQSKIFVSAAVASGGIEGDPRSVLDGWIQDYPIPEKVPEFTLAMYQEMIRIAAEEADQKV